MDIKLNQLVETIRKGGAKIFLHAIGGSIAYFVLIAIVTFIYFLGFGFYADKEVNVEDIFILIAAFGIIILFMQAGLMSGILTSYRTLVETGKIGDFFEGMKRYLLKFFGYIILYTIGIIIIFYAFSNFFDSSFVVENKTFFYIMIFFLMFILYFLLIPSITFIPYEGNPLVHTLKFLDKYGNVYFVVFLVVFILSFIPIVNILSSIGMYFVMPLYIMMLYQGEQVLPKEKEEIE